jgi:uncharacterized protein (DUF1330 family)
MPAYVIAYLQVTDQKAFDTYRKAAFASFAPYGAKPIVVDGPFEVLEGMVNPKSVVVVQFEDLATAKRWYASPEYARTIPMRQQAAESSLILVEGLAAAGSAPQVR